MADVLDNLIESGELETHINECLKVSKKVIHNIKPIGECHTCCEDLEDNRLFCNNECSSRYERMIFLSKQKMLRCYG